MKKRKLSSIILFPLAVVGIFAVTLYVQAKTNFISVSNTVNGRELPIYCVQTDEPKVAISFDAAWGDGRLR